MWVSLLTSTCFHTEALATEKQTNKNNYLSNKTINTNATSPSYGAAFALATFATKDLARVAGVVFERAKSRPHPLAPSPPPTFPVLEKERLPHRLESR